MANNKTTEERIAELEDRVTKLEKILTKGTADQTPIAGVAEKKLSMKEYILLKAPSGDVQKTLAIACYLEQNVGMASFNIEDLATHFRLAKEPVPGNLNDKINMNIGKGHITEAKEKKDNKKAWVVTSSGEQFVENGFKK